MEVVCHAQSFRVVILWPEGEIGRTTQERAAEEGQSWTELDEVGCVAALSGSFVWKSLMLDFDLGVFISGRICSLSVPKIAGPRFVAGSCLRASCCLQIPRQLEALRVPTK